jgi:putative effector of murein hydrolase LrgA (UPF0299 family)
MQNRRLLIGLIFASLLTLHFFVLLLVNLLTGDPFEANYWPLIVIKFVATICSLCVTCYLVERFAGRWDTNKTLKSHTPKK